MKNIAVAFGGLVLIIICIVIFSALGIGGRWINLKVEGWFAPREANVQRKIFEENKSFNEGMEQQLVKYKYEFDRAEAKEDTGTMKAVESAVRVPVE